MYKNRVLIVDDQELGRETLEQLLASEGYQLAFATGGKEALTKAEELSPDIILLDVIMPDMDGFEVCTRLRAHQKLAEVPIIMITGFNDRTSRTRGIEVGADDFISKPFEADELRARIRTIVRLNRYRHLLAERSRFEWAVEQSNDGYLVLNHGDMIQYANSSARFYLGILKESTLPASFLGLTEQQKYQREPAAAWLDWPNPHVGSTPRYLVRAETNQSHSLWLQADILELPTDRMSTQLLHLRDVSEHMNLQQQMWTFQTLVSHKLRGPLNGLVGLQMLDEQLIDLSSKRAQTLLRIARESAKRLQDQILEILRYIDSSQLLQFNNIFNLSGLSALLEKIKNDIPVKTMSVSIADSLVEKQLKISNQGIELILRELFTNSKKFHPQQSPAIAVLVTPGEAKTIILRFGDDGCCLLEKEIDKVWTPYYQVEKYFTGEVKGMGLGLPMVARLVWSSGGNCRLINRDDQPGVIVELILPILER
jgi:DNA-binding response OmpR family regulator